MPGGASPREFSGAAMGLTYCWVKYYNRKWYFPLDGVSWCWGKERLFSRDRRPTPGRVADTVI